MGNDDSDVASLFVGGNLLKVDSGFADSSMAGKSAMSHPYPPVANQQMNRRKIKRQRK